MVNLKKMSAGEFAAYRQCFILEYAQDLQDSRGYDTEKARAIATQSIDIALPQGSDTAENSLWCIHADNTEPVIGYLWVVFNKHSAWVSDFFLLPAWRGLGLGKASLLEMEAAVAAVGINEIGLRVAVNNQSAKALYEKIGFQTTGFNMNKILNSDRQSRNIVNGYHGSPSLILSLSASLKFKKKAPIDIAGSSLQRNVDFYQGQHQESHNGHTINTKKDNEYPRSGTVNWRINHRTRFRCHHRGAQLAV